MAEDSNIHSTLLHFLRKLGYKSTEKAFLQESQHEDAKIELNGLVDSDPLLFASDSKILIQEEFEVLLEWLENSLEPFREELLRFKIPIFFHLSFLILKRHDSEQCTLHSDWFSLRVYFAVQIRVQP